MIISLRIVTEKINASFFTLFTFSVTFLPKITKVGSSCVLSLWRAEHMNILYTIHTCSGVCVLVFRQVALWQWPIDTR